MLKESAEFRTLNNENKTFVVGKVVDKFVAQEARRERKREKRKQKKKAAVKDEDLQREAHLPAPVPNTERGYALTGENKEEEDVEVKSEDLDPAYDDLREIKKEEDIEVKSEDLDSAYDDSLVDGRAFGPVAWVCLPSSLWDFHIDLSRTHITRMTTPSPLLVALAIGR